MYFGMTLALRMQGPIERLLGELNSTRSSRRKAEIIRKLALGHDPDVIDALAPYLAEGGRVGRAAVEAIASFGEQAREPLLAILGAQHRRELHVGALLALAGVVRGGTAHCEVRAPRRWPAPARGQHLASSEGDGGCSGNP